MRVTEKYVLFWGGEFSQWYKARFEENNIVYTSAEQYMMHKKALLFNDNEIADKIMSVDNVKAIKQLGRQVKGFDEEQWQDNRDEIVYTGNYLKFSQNKNLKKRLFEHRGKTFVEASPYDKIWGIGLHFDDERANDEKTWRGINLLGKAITAVMHKLQEEEGIV